MQHSIATIFVFSACLLCHDKVFSVATDLYLALLTLFPARFIVLSISCRDILMCVYLNNYVATLTMVLQQCFCLASSKLCHDPVYMSRQHLCWFLLQQCFLSCQHSCRDKILSPLNLISCCNFIFMLQHSLLVLYMFSVAT